MGCPRVVSEDLFFNGCPVDLEKYCWLDVSDIVLGQSGSNNIHPHSNTTLVSVSVPINLAHKS